MDIALVLIYIVFVWLVFVHTLEEIACGIFEMQIGPINVHKNKYLLAASGIAAVNLGTLVLIVLGSPLGLSLGLFTTAVLGVLQGIVHTVGFIRAGGKMRALGAGFYSAIPLTIIGAVTFWMIVQRLF